MRYSGAKEEFDTVLAATLPNRDPLEVLDAGCGASLRVDVSKKIRKTGIDISEDSMAGNESLDERIVGDLETYKLPRKYDAIFCLDVLEHLRDPEKAINNLCSALSDGGVIIIKMPNVLSLKGLVTKFTPHSFHVFIVKRVFDVKDAGQPGQVPFPTFLRFSLSPENLRKTLKKNGIDIVFFDLFEGNQPIKLRKKSPLLFQAYNFLCSVMNFSTMGRNDARMSELSLIGRKAASVPVVHLEPSESRNRAGSLQALGASRLSEPERARSDGTVPHG